MSKASLIQAYSTPLPFLIEKGSLMVTAFTGKQRLLKEI